ncbi:MAG: SNF2 helicase associated domain-containing protein [Myxococcales bacterium]|nr:SNF2 helicase associated domain-containing protein [Myxococcales bacterium]
MSTTAPTDLPPAADLGWLQPLRDEVPPVTFRKGRAYAEGRRVSELVRQADKLSARVLGSSGARYDVEVWPEASPNGQQVGSRCNCLAWGKYGPHCKHVVAAALVCLARARAQQEGEGAQVVSLPALAKIESWLGLSALPDFEFLYRLTPVQGTGTRHWVVDVRRVEAQTKGPVHVKRLLSTGARIGPADERIFLELARHESRYDARVVLSDEDLAELVEPLRQRKVIYRGTPLFFSDSPAQLHVQLDVKPEGATARIGLLLPDGMQVQLKGAILLAGRRSWAIVGQSLHPLQPEPPPRLIRKWLLEPSMPFPVSQLDRVLTFFAAHLPRHSLSLRADGIDVDESTPPRFVLTLEGGAEHVRAKLAARYGHTTVPVSPAASHLGYAAGVREGGRKLYRRDEPAERAAAKLLLDRGFRFDSASASFEAQGDAAIELWAAGLKELPADWELFGAERKVKLRARVRPRVRVSMSGVHWFELDAEFAVEDQSVDLGAVRIWLDSNRRYIRLKDGSFAEADREELSKAALLLEEAGALPGKSRTRLPLYQAPALELLSSLGGVEVQAKARGAIAELRNLDGIPKVKPPPALQGTLRHYQEGGLSWLWFLHRHGLSGILADDMGLGKTVQALALLQRVKDEEGRRPSLVVAPTSVLANWEREAQRFTPELATVVWHGQDRKERADRLASTDLVLTSYALVRRDVQELSKVGFRYVILDEAQNIKNADSATALACKSLPSELRLALTGTPLENRLSELWSIFDFLMPLFLGSAEDFSERYEQPVQVVGDLSARDRLKRRIRPFVMRRLKSEVAKELPPKTETVAWCELEPGQAALYREVLEESRRKVYASMEKVGFGRSRMSILAALLRMRQVCCDPRLLKLPPGTLLPPSAKLERFVGLVRDLVDEGHRALVFSQFTEMLALLKEQADLLGLRYLYLDGRTRDRMSKVDEFNAQEGPPIFFISLKAGGTGLNLTAADYVIHYDPWWNPAVEDQATDRTHRIGQTKAVIAYKLVTKGTIEEKILELQRRKRELAEGVLSAGSDMGKLISEQDVEELFQLE